MNATPADRIDYNKPLPRSSFLNLVNQAINTGEFRFARQASLSWLAVYPGDLMVNLILTRALLGEGKKSQALPILEKITRQDPEFMEAQQLLAASSMDSSSGESAKAVLVAMEYARPGSMANQEWCLHIRAGQKALRIGQVDEAEKSVQKALLSNPDNPIPAINLVQIAARKGDLPTVQNLAEMYHRRWPDCLQFSLYLVDARIKRGDEAGAVSLMHQCVAHDTAGQVPLRHWGAFHPYKPLWPDEMSIRFSLAVPAGVSALMGWNVLGTGPVSVPVPTAGSAPVTAAEPPSSQMPQPAVTPTPQPAATPTPQPAAAYPKPTRPKSLSNDLQQIQDEFERIAKRIKKPAAARVDGRFPIYVILSTRKGLEGQYGSSLTVAILDQMKALNGEVQNRPGWGSLVFLPDDPDCMNPLGLQSLTEIDPWKIKISIADLDHALGKRGQMIGAVLIIGGPCVVPFHHLPNPTDDSDSEVQSDNPYATTDDNYFVPEWPVGRLPGDATPNADLLLAKLSQVITTHNRSRAKSLPWQRIPLLGLLLRNIRSILSRGSFFSNTRPSFGYTAEVWRPSSQEVFRAIGQNQSLLDSPPTQSATLASSKFLPANLGYYNLHGIADGAEWFGQKAAGDLADFPDYPVALTPADIQAGKHSPAFIFTEACYGALIDSKKIDEAISLRFLSAGAKALVGSTCIAYGSVASPLTAADYLGQVFWQKLNQGQTVGEAFVQAKVALAREMSKRQGYLDGEDQKTLLSFILLGDPLAALEKNETAPKSVQRMRNHPMVKTICDHRQDSPTLDTLNVELLDQVKKIVDQYLPGLKNAEVNLNHQKCACSDTSGHCAGCQVRSKDAAVRPGERMVFTLSKQSTVDNYTHRQYARLTMNSRGKLLKLSTSR